MFLPCFGVGELLLEVCTNITVTRVYCNSVYVRVDVGNIFLRLSHMFDFEGTGTPKKHILNFLRQFSSGLFLMQFATVKHLCTKLYPLITNKRNVLYSVFLMSATQQIELNCVTSVMQCTQTLDDRTGIVRVIQLPFKLPCIISNFVTETLKSIE